jgi:hypothetical protein
MLIGIPKRWASWDFTIMDGPRVVAEIDTSWWRERGELAVDGVRYRVYREGMASGDFIIEGAGSVVARAEKPSAFRRAFTIKAADKRYTLRAKDAFRRTFVLLEGDREIGSLSLAGFFTRRVAVDLPAQLSLPLRMFIVWLSVVLWKRDAAAAA